jgi:hypothetical protein
MSCQSRLAEKHLALSSIQNAFGRWPTTSRGINRVGKRSQSVGATSRNLVWRRIWEEFQFPMHPSQRWRSLRLYGNGTLRNLFIACYFILSQTTLRLRRSASRNCSKNGDHRLRWLPANSWTRHSLSFKCLEGCGTVIGNDNRKRCCRSCRFEMILPFRSRLCANGTNADIPGQRPGRTHAFKPFAPTEQHVSLSASTPLWGSAIYIGRTFPGRCPGLSPFAPLGHSHPLRIATESNWGETPTVLRYIFLRTES